MDQRVENLPVGCWFDVKWPVARGLNHVVCLPAVRRQAADWVLGVCRWRVAGNVGCG
jgi:hypothetical protein